MWKGPLAGTTATAEAGGWIFRRPLPGFACETAFLPEKPPIDGAGLIRVRLTLSCDQLLLVRSLMLPALGIGDGSFGAEKRMALLPGLEYAIGGERTSGSEFCVPELASRVVPHPYKVTIPLATVIAGGVASGWIWDPAQSTKPAAIFASPNFVRGEANHFATLAWPGVGDGRDENEVFPSAQRLLQKGESVTIEASLFAMAADDVDGPLSLWIACRNGVPQPPAIPFDYARYLDAFAVELTRITWVEREAKWHRALPDPWSPAFIDENALFLAWRLALPAAAAAKPASSDPLAFAWTGFDEERAKLAREVLEKACRRRQEEARRGSWGPNLSFLHGGVADALRGQRSHAAALAATLALGGATFAALCAITGEIGIHALSLYGPVTALGLAAHATLFALFGVFFRRATILALAYAFFVEAFLGNMPGIIQRASVSFFIRSAVFGLGGIESNNPLFLPVSPSAAMITLATAALAFALLGWWGFRTREYRAAEA